VNAVGKYGPLYEGDNDLRMPEGSVPLFIGWQRGGPDDETRRVFLWALAPDTSTTTRRIALVGSGVEVGGAYVGSTLGPGRHTGREVHAFDKGEVAGGS